MPLLSRHETTAGPVAIDGHTITLVARTSTVRVGEGGRRALHIRSQPTAVEVLHTDGRHEVVRIRDVERAALVASGLATVIGVGAARWWRYRVREGRTR